MNRRTDNRILLVEDNPDDVELTLHALKRSKISNQVVVAKDGVEALDYLFSEQEPDGARLPAVVLLDLNLPKISGGDVLKRIRADERTRLLPVVILTTSGEQQDVVSSYSNGANSYIRKPVDFNQFAEAVQQLGLYCLMLNQAPLSEESC
jgi:two-component system, response regulator